MQWSFDWSSCFFLCSEASNLLGFYMQWSFDWSSYFFVCSLASNLLGFNMQHCDFLDPWLKISLILLLNIFQMSPWNKSSISDEGGVHVLNFPIFLFGPQGGKYWRYAISYAIYAYFYTFWSSQYSTYKNQLRSYSESS